MSLQVNFTAHGHDLRAAYESILRPSDPKNGDNWALFGYDKGTNDLKVLGQGNGGLEELQEEFMDGKVQYAFARILDPNSKLNKFVLVAWCGDGVPESKKGLFNSHLADVSLFLKGYHLQINARCEADVTPAQIMKRLNEASGSKYSIHNETHQPERITPLQSAYKKTEIPDIAALQRNPTKPEPAPKYNIGGSKPLSSSTTTAAFAPPTTPSKLEGRVWPPPSSSSSNSGAASPPSSKPAVAERSWKSSGGGSSYTASTGSGFNKVAPPASLLSYANSTPEPVVNKAHQMRLEREAREKEERERIKREIEASEARERQSREGGSAGQSTAQKLAEERRLQEEKERERERERGEQEQQASQSQGSNRVREERLAREKEERERAEAEDAARSAREMFKAREQSSAREQATQREDDLKQQQQQQQQKREREAREAREAEERRQQEQEEQQRQQRQAEDARRRQDDVDAQQREEEEQRRLIQQEQERQEEEQQRQLHLHEEEERQRQEAEAEEHERRLQEEVSAATAQSVALGADALLASTEHPELTVAGSVSAIVLYSYDKSEENEMTLYEGEIIRNVTELDVGWWSGESEDGTRSGLFPANYVEVIEHAHEQQHAGLNGNGASAEATAYQHQDDHSHVDSQDVQAHAHAAEDHVEAHAAAPDAGHAKKPSAVALYDYQAGEPNEISFAEGETIAEIEFVTDDWWSGKTEAGAVGLFPANYVEMIA
ncbi:hypothetical protein BGZ75_001127 [Mortierella antarctica]|nr:hypothetical protein BGZ75_001127 [Mortierella antarctica]